MAVDRFWRLYYDPAYLQSLDTDGAAAVILHEVGHLLLKHHHRAAGIVPANDPKSWERWNCAADCAVNHLLTAEGVPLPGEPDTAERYNLPAGRSAEQYYTALGQGDPQQGDEGDEEPDQDGEKGDGDQGDEGDEGEGDPADEPGNDSGEGEGEGDEPGQGEGSGDGQGDEGDGQGQGPAAEPGEGGSCADGQPRPWEDGPPGEGSGGDEGNAPGIEPHEADQLIQQVAERLEKDRGDGAGHWQEFVDGILRPRVDPRRLLMRAVQAHTENLLAGSGGRFTYRRPSRRPSQGGLIRPRSFRPVPRILVILDTSGSMTRTDLALSLGLVARVLSGLNLRDGVRVITADASVQNDMRVFDPSKIEIVGRGGTSFAAMIDAGQELDERPELVIICTDGADYWPTERAPMPVVACLTQAPPDWAPVPAWVDRVNLY